MKYTPVTFDRSDESAKALESGHSGTPGELAEIAHTSVRHARSVLHTLNAEARAVIISWRENPHGSPTPRYALRLRDTQRDAPRPSRRSDTRAAILKAIALSTWGEARRTR